MAELKDHEYAEIGRALFYKFEYKVNAILERQGYDDTFVWGRENASFLSRGFLAGWSPMHTVDIIQALAEEGIFELKLVPKW